MLFRQMKPQNVLFDGKKYAVGRDVFCRNLRVYTRELIVSSFPEKVVL